MRPLEEFDDNVHSQSGEDGILREILSRLGVLDRQGEKWCVEFGAWDGVHLSNTYNLIANHGFCAVLIEGNRKRYKQLCRNIPQDEVIKVCRFVSLDGNNRLEAILGETPIPEDFDLLSIDIDSCDYHVWQSVTAYQPKVVIIEFNPTFPVDVAYVQPPDFTLNHGNGVKALDNLAHEKGYTTVHLTHTNLIAVRDDVLDSVVSEPPPTVEALADPAARRFIFVGYDGTVLSNFEKLPNEWHPTHIDMNDLQFLPRFLRRYTGDSTPLHWASFAFLDYWRRLRRALHGKD
jgi:hypothetical protein